MALFSGDGAPVIVGHVGRKRLRFALADRDGKVDLGDVRTFEAASNTSISGAIATFLDERGLQGRSVRSTIAVAGLVRGDSISVTHTRWFVSRSGLHAMLGHAPLLLNDFEAQAWAMATEGKGQGDGTWCVTGITSGLGVSVFRRHGDAISVVGTEAGHMTFSSPIPELAELLTALFPGQVAPPAEALVSAPGLVAIYRHLTQARGELPRLSSPEAIIAANASDPVAGRACSLLAQAFASHLGNLVLAYGAWDGVIATGGLATALHPAWSDADVSAAFAGTGKYARLLSAVPRHAATIELGELIGAAAAFRAAHGNRIAHRPAAAWAPATDAEAPLQFPQPRSTACAGRMI